MCSCELHPLCRDCRSGFFCGEIEIEAMQRKKALNSREKRRCLKSFGGGRGNGGDERRSAWCEEAEGRGGSGDRVQGQAESAKDVVVRGDAERRWLLGQLDAVKKR